MIANKKTHIIYRSIFLLISLVGIIGSFGTFKGAYNPDFYLYFTNISNYLCFFVILTLLMNDIKKFKNGVKEELSELAPNFRMSVCVMIFVTFLVYNTLLSNPFEAKYWIDFQSLITHLICPVLFIVDYMLFSKHRTLHVYAPFLACIMPFIYVFYILVRAEIYVGTGKMVYPYFFLNVYELGWGNVILYLFAICAVVIGIGYVFWAYDKLVKSEDNKLKFDFSPLPKPEIIVTETNNEVISENKDDETKAEVEEKSQDEVVEVNEKTTTRKPRKKKAENE